MQGAWGLEVVRSPRYNILGKSIRDISLASFLILCQEALLASPPPEGGCPKLTQWCLLDIPKPKGGSDVVASFLIPIHVSLCLYLNCIKSITYILTYTVRWSQSSEIEQPLLVPIAVCGENSHRLITEWIIFQHGKSKQYPWCLFSTVYTGQPISHHCPVPVSHLTPSPASLPSSPHPCKQPSTYYIVYFYSRLDIDVKPAVVSLSAFSHLTNGSVLPRILWCSCAPVFCPWLLWRVLRWTWSARVFTPWTADFLEFTMYPSNELAVWRRLVLVLVGFYLGFGF